MQIKFRLLREGSEAPVRIVTEEFDSIVSAGRFAQKMMDGSTMDGSVETLDNAVGDPQLVVINWSKIAIAYVEPME